MKSAPSPYSLPPHWSARKPCRFAWCMLFLAFLPLVAKSDTKPPPDAHKHWAFHPPRPVSPPTVEDKKWPKTDIDRFILAKLEATKLKPSVPADSRTLIRRMSFDLTGIRSEE